MGTSKTIKIASLAAGLAHLTTFIQNNVGNGYTWAVLTENADGTLQIDERHDNPCYGEMRPYAYGEEKNGPYEPELFPESQRKVRKPGDLFWPFPKGTPLALGVPLYHSGHGEKWNSFFTEFYFNPEHSPYRSVLKDFDIVYKEKSVSGILIKDTEIDPSVMVHMFRTFANCLSSVAHHYTKIEGASLLESITLSTLLSTYNNQYFGQNYGAGKSDWSKIINGLPNDLTDGGTFKQRYAYNRPKQDYLFEGPLTHQTVAEQYLGKKGNHITLNSSDHKKLIQVIRDIKIGKLAAIAA